MWRGRCRDCMRSYHRVHTPLFRVPVAAKRCSRCGLTKPAEQFSPIRRTVAGLQVGSQAYVSDIHLHAQSCHTSSLTKLPRVLVTPQHLTEALTWGREHACIGVTCSSVTKRAGFRSAGACSLCRRQVRRLCCPAVPMQSLPQDRRPEPPACPQSCSQAAALTRRRWHAGAAAPQVRTSA